MPDSEAIAGSAAAVAARRLSFVQQLFISVHSFGLQFHWGALLTVAIPAEVLRFVSSADKGRALGTVLSGGAFIALAVMPLVGAVSDRSLWNLGRRRPFIIAGALLNAAALAALWQAPTFLLFVAAYWFVQFANNLGASAYGGFVPDLVPPEQRGLTSGLMGLMTILGTIGGAITAGIFMGRQERAVVYILIAAVLLATMLLTVWGVHEQPLRRRQPLSLRAFLMGFWVDPRRHPDFAWLFVSRFLTMMGIYTILSFLQFFLMDYLRIERFEQATASVITAVSLGALGSTLAAGWLSDRTGRRAIVSLSAVVMAAACLIFLRVPSFQLMLVLGVIFGIGYGAFSSVDWALATDVLPSKASAARDLGLWGISITLPQVLAPVAGGPILDTFNRLGTNQGYVAIILLAAIYFFAGSATIWNIRGAR